MPALAIAFWFSLLLIVHVYALYPLGIYLRSRLQPAGDPPGPLPDEQLPSLTVLIPAHNEERWIARKIDNTMELEYPRDRFQVVVACDGCTDSTVAIARRYAQRGVEVRHQQQRRGKTATLNGVVPDLRGEIVLLTDANALLAADAARQLVRHFQDPAVGCVTGERVCLPTQSSASQGEGLYWRYEAWIKESESRLGSCLGGTGQVMAVRKFLYPQIPGIGDDFYIPMKILLSRRAKVRFEPRARAWIPAAVNLRLELERKTRSHVSLLRDLPYLKSGLNPRSGAIWWRFLSHHVLRLFVPFALAAALGLDVALWRSGAVYRATTSAQVVFYAAALAGFLLATRQMRARVFYLPFYFVFANLAVFLAWSRWLRGKHQYAWQRTERTLPQAEPVKDARMQQIP